MADPTALAMNTRRGLTCLSAICRGSAGDGVIVGLPPVLMIVAPLRKPAVLGVAA
ncbi:Uncharacterised protein [Mycobacteroides abscessus subsp. abscessus]|nr:Uncharacterised protein [Mycobacteroides abscessus subsp. abscessus]